MARELIGCILVRRIGKKSIRLIITETEGYEGPKDLASHAVLHRTGEYKAVKTPRNEVMFGEAGHFYVYFTYGMHWMLNIVTGKKGHPSAVLIRGAGYIQGPARLTKALYITGALNKKAVGKRGGLWVENGVVVSNRNILRTPRIGVAYAGPVWSKKLYRFVVKNEP